MKLSSLILFLLFAACSPFRGFGQYTIAHVSGLSHHLDSVTGKWTKSESGVEISGNTKLRLGKGHYVLIINKTGFLELSGVGTRTVNDEIANFKTMSKLGVKWLNLAIDSLSASSKNRPYYRKSVIEARTDEDLLSQYPAPTLTLSNSIELRWAPMDNNTYAVRLFRSEKAQYFYRETKEESIELDLGKLHVPSDICLYWTVSVVGSNYSSKPKCIYLLNISESSNIEGPAYLLKEQVGGETSAVGHLMLALFYESHKVQSLAEDHYAEAVKILRGAKRFSQIYYNFLARRNQLIIE